MHFCARDGAITKYMICLLRKVGVYMKAHVLYGINDLRYEDVDRPVLKRNEVLLKVESVGICGSDIPRIYETGAHRHPLIPGHEFAGTVCEVFENGDSSLIGRRVGVFPLIPCGECGPCKNKQYEMCRNYNYLGSRCNGGFAEFVAVPVSNLIKIPDNVSFEDAAMLEPTAVAAHAMRRLLGEEIKSVTENVKNDGDYKNIVVLGLGTIGLLLTMHLLNEFGDNPAYNIIVIGNKEFQREKAMALGIEAKNYCDTKSENVVEWVLEKTDGIGAYAIFECVGRNETVSQAIEVAAPAGKVMLLGNPASDMKLQKNVYWKILRNQLNVMGTWNSSFTGESKDDWHYVVDKLKEGAIAPSKLISHRLKLADLNTGLHIMRDKTEDYVKIMVC